VDARIEDWKLEQAARCRWDCSRIAGATCHRRAVQIDEEQCASPSAATIVRLLCAN